MLQVLHTAQNDSALRQHYAEAHLLEMLLSMGALKQRGWNVLLPGFGIWCASGCSHEHMMNHIKPPGLMKTRLTHCQEDQAGH